MIVNNTSVILCIAFVRLITGKNVRLGEAFTFGQTSNIRMMGREEVPGRLAFLPSRGGSTKYTASNSNDYFGEAINGGSAGGGNDTVTSILELNPAAIKINKRKRVPTEFIAETNLPTDIGQFRLRAYRMDVDDVNSEYPIGTEPCVIYASHKPPFGYDNEEDDDTVLRSHLSNAYRNTNKDAGIPVRIHDQCLTGEVFRSQRCDCREQLYRAMEYIHKNGGCIIYLQQEGRGIGLANKVAAYSLQDTGEFDTVDANLHLGFPEDNRSYGCVPDILEDLGLEKIRLLTNNPRKTKLLRELGIDVVDTIPIVDDDFVNMWNRQYILAKVERMSHDNYQTIFDNEQQKTAPSSPRTIIPPERSIVVASEEDGYCFGRASVEAAIAAIQRGEVVIVVDDSNRENEGDLIVSGQLMTPKSMAFIIRYSSGVICVAMDDEWADKLQLSPMVHNNQDPKGTSFTISVDASSKHGITTGISALERCQTINLLSSKTSTSNDFIRPGHIFPLRAKPNGVLTRNGHTEATVDLMKLAGLSEPYVGVLSEIVSEEDPLDMARLPELQTFAKKHGLVLTSIADIIQYRKDTENT